MIPEQSAEKKDLINISILLAAALCIGIYMIATTTIIAKDGVTFIKYAQKLEAAPVKTMLNERQHPGYPWLILTAHEITDFFHKDTSLFSWIYCAQGATLLSRLITVIILYYIGKKLSDSRLSFWAILILIVLPKPAQYGSDVLSDWSHLCFLAAGLLLMLNGASNKKFWLFGFAGLVCGMGYLIRPECIQLIVAGCLWLVLQLVRRKQIISRDKALCAICLLVIGFLAAAGPYIKLKGTIFPKKSFNLFTQEFRRMEISESSSRIVYVSQFPVSNIAKAFVRLGQSVSETLIWFYVPAILIGMYIWFKTRKWYEPEAFFIRFLMLLNAFLMIFLYSRYGYMSYRHILTLLVLLIFYVSIGLQELAIHLQRIFSNKAGDISVTSRSQKFWFLVLILTGLSMCSYKLFRPVRMEKQGFRATAKWLENNTNNTDIIAVPDIRLIFYACREGLVYENEKTPPSNAVYVVKILKNHEDKTAMTELSGRILYEYNDEHAGGDNLVIYKK